MAKKGWVLLGGLAALLGILLLGRKGGATPPPPGVTHAASVTLTIIGDFLPGKSHLVPFTVTNLSTLAGVPTAASLSWRITGRVGGADLVFSPPGPEVINYPFAASQALEWTEQFNMLGIRGNVGYVEVTVFDGITTLAQARQDFIVL